MKILNCYAGIGGNRKYWDDHKITAIENNKIIANCYQDNFPNDKVIQKDVLNFLEIMNLEKYDLIWLSPPCTSHSRWNVIRKNKIPKLTNIYGLIIFFNYFRKNVKYIIENVKPYYKSLIPPSFKIGRHYFWTNINLNISVNHNEFKIFKFEYLSFWQLAKIFDLNVERIKSLNQTKKRQILRNCVHPKIGKYIIDNIDDSMSKFFKG